jgi:hypothetical protein
MKRQRLTGRDLQKAIIDLAHTHQWRVCHFASVPITRRGKTFYATPVEGDGKGWPDLFLVRRERALAVEVKGDGDRLRPDQERWLADLMAAGIPTFVCGRQQWEDGAMESWLR